MYCTRLPDLLNVHCSQLLLLPSIALSRGVRKRVTYFRFAACIWLRGSWRSPTPPSNPVVLSAFAAAPLENPACIHHERRLVLNNTHSNKMVCNLVLLLRESLVTNCDYRYRFFYCKTATIYSNGDTKVISFVHLLQFFGNISSEDLWNSGLRMS